MNRLNVLHLVHRLPYPPDKGCRIRAFHTLKYLAPRADLHLACLADEPVPEASVAALRRHCARVEVVRLGRWSRWLGALGSLAAGRTVTEGAFGSRALERVVREWARQTRFDVTLT